MVDVDSENKKSEKITGKEINLENDKLCHLYLFFNINKQNYYEKEIK